MYEQLKNFNVDRGSVEEMVALLAFGKMLEAEYESFEDFGIETPDWLTAKLKAIRREIRARHSDNINRKLADAQLRLESLKTPAEKRQAMLAEIKRLQTAAANLEG